MTTSLHLWAVLGKRHPGSETAGQESGLALGLGTELPLPLNSLRVEVTKPQVGTRNCSGT